MAKDKKNIAHLSGGMKTGIAAMIAGSIFVVILISYSTGLLDVLSLKYLDFLFNLRGEVKAREDIIIIELDSKFKKKYRETNAPVSRQKYAQLLKQLNDNGAFIVGFDTVFLEPDNDSNGDAAFEAELIRCEEEELSLVILAGYYDTKIGPRFPIERFPADCGFINVSVDRDGTLRRIRPLFPVIEDETQPDIKTNFGAFSTWIIAYFENISPEEWASGGETDDYFFKVGPKEFKEETMLINYTGGRENYLYLSAVDVIEGTTEMSVFQDAIVLIANTTSESQDFYSVPFSRYAERIISKYSEAGIITDDVYMPGVEVHANAVQSMIENSWIRPVGKGTVFTVLIIIAFLTGFLLYFEKIPGWLAAILGISFIAIEIGISHVQFSGYQFFDMVPILILTILNWGGGAIFKNLILSRTNRQVAGMFGQYVSPQIVEKILAEGVDISNRGKTEDVTVLFSDIRGFTPISEKLSPEEIGVLLNNYFDNMITIVFEHDGTLDKLMGDAIMAFFGDPVKFTDHPHKACNTALKMMARLKELKANPPVPGMEMVNIGIGLNSGVVTVGDLGSFDYRDYTVIGDNVNLGSRVEGMNKLYGTNIIITEFTRDRVGGEFVVRKLDMARVKGRSEPVTLYELVGEQGSVDEKRLATLKKFEEGLELYFSGEFKNAVSLFQKVLEDGPDGPSETFLNRSMEYMSNPPEKWDGIYTATSK